MRNGADYFPRYKGFTPAGRFVIEKDAVTSIDIVRFAVIDGHPVSVQFRYRIGTPRVKKRLLVLGDLLHFPEQLRTGRLVESAVDTGFTDCFEDPGSAKCGYIACVFEDLKTDLEMALCSEMVYFIGLEPI